MKPKITVITISYNAKEYIEVTIKSVLSQSYNNIEYIIIDGNSSDGTLDIINKYKDEIDVIVSEPDKGIYDAMNKGIDIATGDFCLFMNSGDYFYTIDSIEKAVNLFENDSVVIYGNTEYRYDYGRVIRVPAQLSHILNGAFCCHQSAFFNTKILKGVHYDLSYKIVADWVLFRTLYLQGAKFQYIDTIIASYDNIEGASTANSVKSFIKHQKEKARCTGEEGGILFKFQLYVKASLFFIRRRIIIPLLPSKLYYYLKAKWITINKY